MSSPKRKRFWIDPSTQIRVLAFVLGLLAASLALAFISMDRGLALAAEQTRRLFVPIDWARQALRGPFLFSSTIILLGGALLTLLWSHRVVGPLLVMAAGLRRIREGNLRVEVKTRDTDALKDTVEDFAAMQHALRKQLEQDRDRVAALQQRLAAIAEKLDGRAAERRELEAIRDELGSVTSFFQL